VYLGLDILLIGLQFVTFLAVTLEGGKRVGGVLIRRVERGQINYDRRDLPKSDSQELCKED
jgi:hypothetical protein